MASKMTPTVTDTFPKMGDDGLASVVNVSGQRSAYTMPEGRKGPASDNPPDSPAAHKGATLIHEAHGPTFRPVATRLPQQPDYPETGRAIRTVPSAIGNRDFWDQRQDGQTIG